MGVFCLIFYNQLFNLNYYPPFTNIQNEKTTTH